MLRNLEIKLFLFAFISIFILSIVVAIFMSISPIILVVVVGVLYMILCITFTWYRYRSIRKLSEYVRHISSGDYTLDVRDNVEGELSILKNEIYKVTSKLAEQSSALQEDKVHLMDSISDISHQLKTPLTSMTMMADFLSSSTLPVEKREEFSSLLLKQLERIDWLVSSLLKLSKIDAGTVRFSKEHMHTDVFVDYILEHIDGKIANTNNPIVTHGQKDSLVWCDKNWTAEALINIINNCIEHSPESKAVELRWMSNALYTQIKVHDHGPGIPLEERTQIFKRFFKGKHASEDSVGIGLAMAHSIITNQQGSIEVDSEVGKGTTFTITFYHPKMK